jgi:hypothetical protein
MPSLTITPRRLYRLGSVSACVGLSILAVSALLIIVPRATASTPNSQCCSQFAQKGTTGASGSCKQLYNDGNYYCGEQGTNKCTAGTFCGGYIDGKCKSGTSSQYCVVVHLSNQGYNYTWMCPGTDGFNGCTCVPNWQTTQCGGNVNYDDCGSGSDSCS